MKRDRKLQETILKRVESHDYPLMRFESFWVDAGGYEDIKTEDWSDDEAYNIRLLIRDGLLFKEHLRDAPWLGTGKSEPGAETYISLTSAGHDWLEGRSFFERAVDNVLSNLPTILISFALAWLLYFLGPPSQ